MGTDAESGVTPGVELLRRSLQAFNRGDIDSCVQILSPEFIANIPGLPEPQRGRDAWKQNALMFREAFPDLNVAIFGAGDRVAVRLTFRGTHEGPFLGVEPTGRRVAFTSVELYRVSDDYIAEEWVSPDINSLMTQITGPSAG
jgi:predicted ester cyclase